MHKHDSQSRRQYQWRVQNLALTGQYMTNPDAIVFKRTGPIVGQVQSRGWKSVVELYVCMH